MFVLLFCNKVCLLLIFFSWNLPCQKQTLYVAKTRYTKNIRENERRTVSECLITIITKQIQTRQKDSILEINDYQR